MVTAKLSKTSNLIWYLSGQLTDVATGRRLLDDEFELKGIAEDIAKGGAHSLARRILKAAEPARPAAVSTTRMDPAAAQGEAGRRPATTPWISAKWTSAGWTSEEWTSSGPT